MSNMKPARDDMMETLRHARKSKKLRADELSEAIGYAVTCVSAWERGANRPTLTALENWCQSLGYELTLRRISAPTESPST